MSLPQELLQVARELCIVSTTSVPVSQGTIRRASPTAYYALFHLLIDAAASEYLNDADKNCVFFSDENEFKKIVDTYKLSIGPLNTQIKSVSTAFIDLQKNRLLADYDLATPRANSQASTDVMRASAAFTDWKKVPASDSQRAMFLFFLSHKIREKAST